MQPTRPIGTPSGQSAPIVHSTPPPNPSAVAQYNPPVVGYHQPVTPNPSQPAMPAGSVATATPILTQMDSLIRTLTDQSQQDDVKYMALKEISENFDELVSASGGSGGTAGGAAQPLSTFNAMDSLLRAFVRLLQETSPQFISENNTLQLRKLIFELLLRLSSTNDAVKAHSKQIQLLLFRIAHAENEENTLLILKILTDHLRLLRPAPSPELLSHFFNEWKRAFAEMSRHAAGERMFLPAGPLQTNQASIEAGVIEALQSCYTTTTLTFTSFQTQTPPGQHGQHGGAPHQPSQSPLPPGEMVYCEYSLIPRATHSVKVLAEVASFIYILLQVHRQQLASDVADLIPLMTRYINVRPPSPTPGQQRNAELVDEFHASQIRALTLLTYITRHQQQQRQQPASTAGSGSGQQQLSAYDTQINDRLEESAPAIASAIGQLLESLNGDVITQRRDLLLATKHFFQSDLRTHFVSVIPRIATSHLLGASFTAQDQLRIHNCTLLADILHHARSSLSFDTLVGVYQLCIRQLNDPRLIPHVQIMYGRLMMNFADPLAKHQQQGRDISRCILPAMDAFVRKARLIADLHLPAIVEKSRAVQSETSSVAAPNDATASNGGTSNPEKALQRTGGDGAEIAASDMGKQGITAAQAAAPYWQDGQPPIALADCRNMVRYIVQPMKMMVLAWNAHCAGVAHSEQSREYDIASMLSEFFVAGVRCMEVFAVGTPSSASSSHRSPLIYRSKEERETMDYFVGIYVSVEPALFRSIVGQHVDFFVERITANPQLQNVCHALFVNPTTVVTMGEVMVRYLLERLPEMGTSNEKAALYLKLFKLVFSSVSNNNSQLPSSVTAECEAMLKPHLSTIVEESMQLALRCRESTNYFLLLRALFRSIGSGAHDLLYQQFLPLLPKILQQLNRLQNGSHRQPIHELFVELCLTIPVRLSSLLPYLPLLMDPLVCALYGSPTLVQQGLRTLELCVDNLQPDYLYDHMAPVRAALMRGLWRTVGASSSGGAEMNGVSVVGIIGFDQTNASSQSAFRILGKFGGSSRKVFLDARSIDYVPVARSLLNSRQVDGGKPPLLCILYGRDKPHHDDTAMEVDDASSGAGSTSQKRITPLQLDIPLSELIESAVQVLRNAQLGHEASYTSSAASSSGGAPNSMPPLQAAQYAPKAQALELVKAVLYHAILPNASTSSGDDDAKGWECPAVLELDRAKVQEALEAAINRAGSSGQESDKGDGRRGSTQGDRLCKTAMVGLFYAVMNGELKQRCFPLFKELIRFATIQAIIGRTYPDTSSAVPDAPPPSLNAAAVMIEAVTTVLADPYIDFYHAPTAALRLLIDTATTLFNGDAERVGQLPLLSHALEKIALLCYRREWYARLGGCTALKLIIQHYPASFVRREAAIFLNALLEMTSGLADEVSSGALDFACGTMDILLAVCFGGDGAQGSEVEGRLVESFLARFVERLDDAEALVRDECARILNSIASRTGRSRAELLRPKSTPLASTLQRGIHEFATFSQESQIGFMSLYCFVAESAVGITLPQQLVNRFVENLLFIFSRGGPEDRHSALIRHASSSSFPTVSSGSGGNSESSSGGRPSSQTASECDGRAFELKRAAINAIATRCMELATQGRQQQPSPEDIDLREEPLSSNAGGTTRSIPAWELFQVLLDNSQSMVSAIQQACLVAIRKILTVAPEFNNAVEARIASLVSGMESSSQAMREGLSRLDTAELKNVNLLGNALSGPLQSMEPLRWVIAQAREGLELEGTNGVREGDSPVLMEVVRLCIRMGHWDGEFVGRLIDSIAFRMRSAPEKHRDWIEPLVELSLIGAEESAAMVLEGERLESRVVSRLMLAIVTHPRSAPIRQALLIPEKMEKFTALVAQPDTSSGKLASALQLLLALFESPEGAEWARVGGIHDSATLALFSALKALWSGEEFKSRYAFSESLPLGGSVHAESSRRVEGGEAKFDVPALCVRAMLFHLRHLLSSPDGETASVELIYELVYAFCHTYIADFTPLRKFIDDEIVPNTSLSWRRRAFRKLVDELRALHVSKHSASEQQHAPRVAPNEEQLVRFMQYIVAPCFHYAFERHDVDAVVGSAADPERDDPDNVVSAVCGEIIERGYHKSMSDALTIVMFQFCVLLVQRCPSHIHSANRKNKTQGTRLRQLMLFAWPCLHANFQRDVTEKYSGLLFIANIIDKFAIARKIVLQVLNALLTVHQTDHRDMVKKALDILIAAVPKRMADDGQLELANMLKKVMTESESAQRPTVIQHCLSLVIRHYKVFYPVRHQLAPTLLQSLQRVLSTVYGTGGSSGALEGRRLVVDICEMFTKWEQDRRSALSDGGASEGDEGAAATTTTMEAPNEPQSSSSPQTDAIVNRPFAKGVVEQVLLLLWRSATTPSEQSPGSSSSSSSSSSTSSSLAMSELNKRSILLLRTALKPSAFGELASIRPQLVAKQLASTQSDPTQLGEPTPPGSTLQLLITLDVMASIVQHVPLSSLAELYRPLYRNFFHHLGDTNLHIARSAYNVVTKLLERVHSSLPATSEDFAHLQRYVVKFVQDTLTTYCSAGQAPPQPLLITSSLAKYVTPAIMPSLLDGHCLSDTLKTLQRLIPQYPVQSHGSGQSATDQLQKLLTEILFTSFETLLLRMDHMQMEHKRQLSTHILAPLMEKNPADKLTESMMRLIHQMLVDPATSTTLGVLLLVRLGMLMESRLLGNADLLRTYLNSVLYVYEQDELRKLDIVHARLRNPLYWALCCAETPTRKRAFAVLTKSMPKDALERLMHTMSKINWEPMGQYSWTAHLVHVMLLSHCPQREPASTGDDAKTGAADFRTLGRRLRTKGAGSFHDAWTPLLAAATTVKSVVDKDEPMDTGEAAEDGTATIDRAVAMVNECYSKLTTMASVEQRFEGLIDALVDFLHFDWVCANIVFAELFRSLWRQLLDRERSALSELAQPLLASSVMLPQRESPFSIVRCLLEAFVSCEPPMHFEPAILAYLGETHNCWHLAIKELERDTLGIRLAHNSALMSDHSQPARHFEKLEVLDALAGLYAKLDECDAHDAVWRRRACFDTTPNCLTLLHHNEYRAARELAEKLMSQLNERLARASPSDPLNELSLAVQSELQLWERVWVEACRELSDWPSLQHFANSDEVADALLIMESAWHLGDWRLLKECMMQVDACASQKAYIKSSMFKAMANIIHYSPYSEAANTHQQQPSSVVKDVVDKQLIEINKLLIAEWRRLPVGSVSYSHLDLLHNAHLVHEVAEATNILLPGVVASPASHQLFAQQRSAGVSLHNNVRHVMKSWRTRPLTFVDSLAAWHEIFTWRFQIYRNIVRLIQGSTASGVVPGGGELQTQSQQQQSTFFLHSLAQSHLHLGSLLRRSGQLDAAVDELNKLHDLPSLHPMDAQLKIYEHAKCLVALATNPATASGAGSASASSSVVVGGGGSRPEAIYEALELIEGTQLQFLKKEQASRLMIAKGILLSKLDKREEANRAFSAAAALDDTAVTASAVGTSSSLPTGALAASNNVALWKHWGEHLENLFLTNYSENTALNVGLQALACLLECARISTPLKSRVHLARVFWLVKMIHSAGPSLNAPLEDMLRRTVGSIPTANWLFWVNEIVADVHQRANNTSAMAELIATLGDAFPQQVFPVLRANLDTRKVGERIRKVQEKLSSLSDWQRELGDLQHQPSSDSDIMPQCVGSTNDASSCIGNGGHNGSDETISATAALPGHSTRRRKKRLLPSVPSPSVFVDWDDKLLWALECLCLNHPVEIVHLNRVFDELDRFPVSWAEAMLDSVRELLAECHAECSTHASEIATRRASPQLLRRIQQWVGSVAGPFGMSGTEQTEAVRRGLVADFDMARMENAHLLHSLGSLLRRWLGRLRALVAQEVGHHVNGLQLLRDASPYLADFNSKMAPLQVFSTSYGTTRMPAHHAALIAQFMPTYQVRLHHDRVSRVLVVRAVNGKLYPYRLERVGRYDSSRTMIYQLFTLLNAEMAKERSTCERFLQLAVPQVIHLGDAFQLMECGGPISSNNVGPALPLSGTGPEVAARADDFIALADVMDEMLARERNSSAVEVLEHYYSRLRDQRYCHKTLLELFNGISCEQRVPKWLLAKWMAERYPDATSLWEAKKRIALQLALIALVEHSLHLTAMNLNGLVLDLPTAQVYASDYRFDLSRKMCDSVAGKVPYIELDANKPVSFRLSANLAHLLGLSAEGHYAGALVAVARCFASRHVHRLVRPFLWDVFAKAVEEDRSEMNLVGPVKRALDAITTRIKNLAQFDEGNSPTTALLASSQHSDNLCRMDPALHSWF